VLRPLAGLLGFVLVLAVGAGGLVELDRHVIDPAERVASGPVPGGEVSSAAVPVYSPHPTTTVPSGRRGLVGPGGRDGSTTVTAAQAGVALAARTPGFRHRVVAVPGGYDAAAFDQSGDIDFWSYRTSTWALTARRLYPTYAAGTAAAVSVRGAALTGMPDATFVVDAPFAATGRAVAYTAGADGWGVLAVSTDGDLRSDGTGATAGETGTDLAVRFVGGDLETVDAPTAFPTAFDASFPVVRRWAWQGDGFAPVGGNILTATATAPPTYDLPPLPVEPVRSGSYLARLVAVRPLAATTDPRLALTLEPLDVGVRCGAATATACGSGEYGTTTVDIAADTPAVLVAATAARNLVFVTGPAWALDVPGGLCCDGEGSAALAAALGHYGAAAWYLPPSLGVAAFVDDADPTVEVTFVDGVATVAELAD
jgi:hypothetical protein